MKRRYEIELVHGTYKTVEVVFADLDDDQEVVIAVAKQQARRRGFYHLPMAYEHERVIKAEDVPL